MTRFTFHVTGASPYDGEIIIIAKTITVAARMARETVEAYNKSTNYSRISLIGGAPGRAPFSVPCVVHFEPGES